MTTVPINRPPLAWALGLQLMLAPLALYRAVSLPGLEANWMFSAMGIALLVLLLGVVEATTLLMWRTVASRKQLAMLALGIVALKLCFGAEAALAKVGR